MAWDRERVVAVRERVEPVFAVVAFVAGFTWDALTLVRIDRWTDNLLLGSYLALLGVALIVEHRLSQSPEDWPRLAPRASWVTLAVQFLFGGLFSAYVVFYLRSATWGPTLLFVMLLGLVFVLNEFLHSLLRRSWLRLALFWFVAFSYLLFLLPVVTGWFGVAMGISAATGATVLGLLVARGMFAERLLAPLDLRRVALFLGLSAGMGLLDAGGCIPPVPLAVLEIGVFHKVEPRTEAGGSRRYWLTYEAPPFWRLFLDESDPFHRGPDDAVYCFTALFAPTGMTTKLFHVWEWWDEAKGSWVPRDRIDITSRGAVVGGRDQGFRTWSRKQNIADGDWRVRVLNEADREVGRTRFSVTSTAATDRAFLERAWD